MNTNSLKFNTLFFLIIFNIFIFVLVYVLNGGFVQSFTISDGVQVYGAFSPAFLEKGFWWILTTPNFLHFEIYHILFNLIALFQIGNLVDNFYEGKKLFITYIFGGLASSIFTYFAYVLGFLNGPISLGASGSVFALLGLLIGGTLKRNRYGSDLPFSISSFVPTLILSVIIAFNPQINFYAHLGGFVLGIIFGLVFSNSLTTFENKSEKLLVKSLYYLSILIFVGSYMALLFNLFLGN